MKDREGIQGYDEEERNRGREWLPTRPQTPHVASRRLKPVPSRLTLVWQCAWQTRGENTREILRVRGRKGDKEAYVR